MLFSVPPLRHPGLEPGSQAARRMATVGAHDVAPGRARGDGAGGAG